MLPDHQVATTWVHHPCGVFSGILRGRIDTFLSTPSAYMSVADEKPFDSVNNDDKELLAFGYKPSFKREFTNLATVSLPKSRNLWRPFDDLS